jgi:hypothetical protein
MHQELSRGAHGGAMSARMSTRSFDRRGRVMLVASPPDVLPPVSFGNGVLHRLRVVIVRNDEVPDIAPSRVVGELPPVEANAMGHTHQRPLRHSRRLQGEILCDAAGRLYEKIGNVVQPIHQLVAGPSGEVLDLAPPLPHRFAGREPTATIDIEAAEAVNDSASQAGTPPSTAPRRDTNDHDAQSPGWRQIPEVRSRIVPVGEFKAVLSPQLAQISRLRDTHRLSCRVHLYECTRTQRLATLSDRIPGCTAGQLLPLTPALAARLDLADVLPRRRPSDPREPGVVVPGDRVVRLEVLDDPTASMAQRIDEPRQSRAAAEAAPPPASTEPVRQVGGKSIPERFLVPWQFAISRDEAIYDLNLEATRPRLGSFLARAWNAAGRRRESRKWQALLTGRSIDDQLWGVRPPGDSLSNPAIREWARRMLEAAGYDPAAMLFEWDVYWRRKRG